MHAGCRRMSPAVSGRHLVPRPVRLRQGRGGQCKHLSRQYAMTGFVGTPGSHRDRALRVPSAVVARGPSALPDARRTIVVMGASSGIGLCTALAFARRGNDVVLVARDADRLDEAARQCQAAGGRTLAVAGDVTDGERMHDVVREAVAAFGRVDVDLLGAVNGAHAVVPHFLEQGGTGVIVNVVSIGGRIASPWATSYSAAKFGLAGFTDALCAELASRSRIRVCGVYPAFVDTPTPRTSGNYTGRSLRPVPPVVSPERVAEAIVELSVRPRRARRVGTMHAVSAAYALAPGTVGRLAARLGGWYFLQAGEPATATDGGLFTARPGPASRRGGWGRRQRFTARSVAASAAVTAAAVAALRQARRRT
jgi:NADP-dependent 3-hydroxy acid dehydrogenase YdfG